MFPQRYTACLYLVVDDLLLFEEVLVQLAHVSFEAGQGLAPQYLRYQVLLLAPECLQILPLAKQRLPVVLQLQVQLLAHIRDPKLLLNHTEKYKMIHYICYNYLNTNVYG